LVILVLGGILLGAILLIFEQTLFYTGWTFFLEGNYNLAERVDNIGVAVDLFLERPLFAQALGVAAHAVDIEEAEERMRYPHNILLEVLSELGIIGFLLISWLLYSSYRCFRKLQNRYENSPVPIALFACFIFTFLNSLTSQYIANPALFAFIGAPYGLARFFSRGDA
jgi:O-antigen ligase